MYFLKYIDNAGEWRWTLKAGNHEPIADSGEGYKRESDCDHGINLVKGTNASTPVKTKTATKA